MSAERTMFALIRRLNYGSTPRQPSHFTKQLSKLARPGNAHFRTSTAARPNPLPSIQQPGPVFWPSAKLYSTLPSPTKTEPKPTPATTPSSTSKSAYTPSTAPYSESEAETEVLPANYELTFTCKPCGHRSTHTITKHGYHKGAVLITCPDCKNRHIISDHLKIFSDNDVTIEDLMRQKGQLVKKGSLGGEGDVEFWDDGTETERVKVEEGKEKGKEDEKKE